MTDHANYCFGIDNPCALPGKTVSTTGKNPVKQKSRLGHDAGTRNQLYNHTVADGTKQYYASRGLCSGCHSETCLGFLVP